LTKNICWTKVTNSAKDWAKVNFLAKIPSFIAKNRGKFDKKYCFQENLSHFLFELSQAGKFRK
jgi:hypothetical protein